MFSIDELKKLEECIGVTISEYEGCGDLTNEYDLLDKIDNLIRELEVDINKGGI